MSNEAKKYLVCLDDSPRAPQVLAAAVDLASRTSAKLTLFRSVGIPGEIAQSDMIGFSPDDLPAQLLDAARSGLAPFEKQVPAAILAGVAVKLGTPWDAICHEAEELGVDLVILGSHGYGGLDRLLGTTAAKVVNHARCSVMVVR